MASEPVKGEGNGGAGERKCFKVYTRKDRRQRKQTPSVTEVVSNNREKPEEAKVEDGNEINRANPLEPLAEEAVNSTSIDKNSVEPVAPQTISQEDAETLSKDPSENVPKEHNSDKAIEAPSQAEVQDVSVDKNTIQPCPGPLTEDDTISVVVEKSVEVPSECLAKEDASTVVIDKNSIEVPPKTLVQNDISTLVVDKNSIDASSQILSHEVAQIDVPKNSIELASEEDVNVVDIDSSAIEAPSQPLAELDASGAPQNAGVTSESVPAHKSTETVAPRTHSIVSGSLPIEEGSDGRIRINLSSSTRQEKEEIRKTLEDQLDLIRGLVRRIEAKEGEIGAYNNNQELLVKTGIRSGGSRILTGFTSPETPRTVVRSSKPLHQLSVSVMENTHGMNEHVEKEKRTPKANQFYRNSEFLLANEKFPPAESNKKSKSSAKKHGGEVGRGFGPGSKVFKNCCTLLEKLMKHKHGWVFNAPVDVNGLGLHDYFTIIKHPMDLGTIKSRLTKNWYKSPREFAEDVRLTFYNAMTYNPKGQDVHVMAEQLLMIFEDRWASTEADYKREMVRSFSDYEVNLPTPRSRLAPTPRPAPINVRNMVNRPEWSSHPLELQPKPVTVTPSSRTPSQKKPKANEPNKRDMTYEEKQKLSSNLQNLPPDKLDAIVQIVRKRNTAVKLRDEEIEVDIDSVDPETLWELDRFVTNYKKSLSKKKRKAELAIQARAEAEKNIRQMTAAVVDQHPREGGTAQKSIPTALTARAEKGDKEEGARCSSSSSSTSDSSSSSSDSDSDSSSSSGSDQT